MVTVKYDGKTIADLSAGEVATLNCEGMVMSDNIEVTNKGSVFIATYGQTTYSDMITAWKSGKDVILKGDVESALTIRMLVHVSTDKIFFGRVLAESQLVEEVIVTSANKWSLIKNNYASKSDLSGCVKTDGLAEQLSNYAGQSWVKDRKYATQSWVKSEAMNSAPKTLTKVFQTTNSGVIRCETNNTYMIYCTGDTEATVRGYGNQNKDSDGNQHEISGKYLTVYCGGQYDTFTDENGNDLSNNGAALWYATAMTQGTLTPVGSMNVRRGVVKHPDGDQWAEISYPSGCSIVITETIVPMTPSEGLIFTSNGDGTCYVSGAGNCRDREIIIPSVVSEGVVTGIGDNAFKDCTAVRYIYIPDSVTSIGNHAFDYCYNLSGIIIPDSVKSIGYSAFYTCKGLTSIAIPESVTSISLQMFYQCSNLTSIDLHDKVTSISNGAFSRCSKLMSITIPKSITSIVDTMFSYCGFTSFNIPNHITSIGKASFRDCEKLAFITIPKSVTSIGGYAFAQCTNLATIYYEGTEEQWNAITKGSQWSEDVGKNTANGTYTVVFNYTPKN